MIIDCFTFFDEIDLLDVRLHELCEVVDVFVLTESPKTFTGKPKKLHFYENRQRFDKFNIIHSVYNDTASISPMERERRQKQYNIDVVFGSVFTVGDVVLQGDCDEIPKAAVVETAVCSGHESALFSLDLFYYYLNCRSTTDRVFQNTRMVRPDRRYQYNGKQDGDVDIIYSHAGWHFSFLGNVREKIAAWGHAPLYNKPPYNTQDHIEKCMREGTDLFLRKGSKGLAFEFVDDLSILPKYIIDNMDRYGKYVRQDHHFLH